MPAQRLLQLVFAVGLAITNLSLYPLSIEAGTAVSQNPPDPPSDPPPDNQAEPGGGLNPPNLSCKNNEKQLTALVPVKSEQGLTLSAHPTFWFYIPYAPKDIRSGEFSLLTRDGKKRLYRTSFTLPETPGIVSISLPPSPEYALQESQYYHWHLELYCQPNTSSKPDLKIDGWVRRIPPTPDLERKIDAATPDIWYDSLTRIANRRLDSDSEILKEQWAKLLESINRSDIAQEKLVGPVRISQ